MRGFFCLIFDTFSVYNFCMGNQNGNALFLILIAVALFAALSYAMTSSGRGGGGIEKEQAMLGASQIVQYVASIEQAIQKMRIFGCNDDEISFIYDSDGDGTVETNGEDEYYNPNTNDDSCKIFNTAGGGLSFLSPPENILTTSGEPYRFTGAMEVTGGVGTNADELIVFIRNIDKDACLSINENLGIPNPGGDAPIENNSTTHLQFVGTYDGSARIIGDNATELAGKYAGCYYNTLDTRYEYYQVLLAR